MDLDKVVRLGDNDTDGDNEVRGEYDRSRSMFTDGFAVILIKGIYGAGDGDRDVSGDSVADRASTILF